MSLKPVSGKIESQELNDNFSYLDSSKAEKKDLADVIKGPTEVHETLKALESKYPTGSKGVHLVTADGHLYYWDKDKWEDGGLYQSRGIDDGSVTEKKVNFTLKYNINFSTNSDVEITENSSEVVIKLGTRGSCVLNCDYEGGGRRQRKIFNHMDGSDETHSLSHGDILVWDLKNNILIKKSKDDLFTGLQSDVVLLAYARRGELNNGALLDVYYQDKIKMMERNAFDSAVYTTFATNSDYEIIPDYNERKVTIKFSPNYSSVLICRYKTGGERKRKHFDSPVEFTLEHNEVLLWDLSENNLIIESSDTITNKVYSDIVLLAFSHEGKIKAGSLLKVTISDDIQQLKSNKSMSGLPYDNTEELLKETAMRVKEKQTIDSFSFINITDTHITPQNQYEQHEAFNNSVLMSNMVGSLFLSHTGDVHQGEPPKGSTKEEALKNLQKAIYNYKSQAHVPVLIAKGNHDDNLWDGEYDQKEYGILPLEWHNYVERPFSNGLVFDRENKDGNYYYRDFEDERLRVIVLNSIDVDYQTNSDGTPEEWAMWGYIFRDRQIQWFAHTALNFDDKPGEWGVIVLAHHPLLENMVTPNNWTPINSNLIVGILESFNSGVAFSGDGEDNSKPRSSTNPHPASVDVDYTGRGGEVILYLNGHTHWDAQYRRNGITYVNQLNSRATQDRINQGLITPKRIMGTDSQEAFDIYTIDRNNKKIYVTRHGAGEDKEIDY